MNVIQIQDLIRKIGELNKNIDLQEYFNNGEDILKSELEIIEEANNELNHRLLIQLKEKSDVELLHEFISFIDKNGEALGELYHKYRTKLSQSNNSNPIYNKSIPIICKLIDSKIDVLTSLKIDLLSKIKYFDYRISSDFESNSNSSLVSESSNQNQEKETAGRATFNLSKKESLMLLYIFEEVNLLKFDNNAQRKNFIEQNLNFTEVRNNESYGKSFPMAGIQSEYSKFNSNDRDELKSNNKTLENLSKRMNSIFETFEFTKKEK